MLEAYLGKSKDEILTWWINNPNDPTFKYAWCAVFVSYMGYKCGYTPELPDGAIPSNFRSWTTNYEFSQLPVQLRNYDIGEYLMVGLRQALVLDTRLRLEIL